MKAPWSFLPRLSGAWLLLAAACCSGQDPSSAVRSILSQTPAADLSKARERLLALGDSAVEPIVETLASEQQAAPPRLAFLVGILSSLDSALSQRALGRLLTDQRPLVRGYSASALGQRRVACAVPQLVLLLDDRAQYGSEVTTDPHQETALTVARGALKALENITGQRPVTSDHVQQAKVFQKWWAKKKNGFNCREWN